MKTAFSILMIIGFITDTSAQPAPQKSSSKTSKKLKTKVEITVKGAYRYVTSNGIPNHLTGRFPGRNNPNAISEQKLEYRMLANPVAAAQIQMIGMYPFGVALNGVPFEPAAAEFWKRDWRSGWQYEALSGKINLGLDSSNAHVQPTGKYHYHGMPEGLISKLGRSRKAIMLGYAADGFPVYNQYCLSDPLKVGSKGMKMKSSCKVKSGNRPDGSPGGKYDGTFLQDYEFIQGLGTLDLCNGHFGITPQNPKGIYHYHITETYPFIPRFFLGTPDPSFMKRAAPTTTAAGATRAGKNVSPGSTQPGKGTRRPPPPGGGKGRFPPPRPR
jgi:hypothetical protein